MARLDEKQRLSIAKQAFAYSGEFQGGYGLQRKTEPCCYGKLVKYLMCQRGFSFSTFAENLGITPQALNHRLNRQKKSNWKTDEVDIYCKLLRFNKEDFLNIANKIMELEVEYAGK